MQYINNSLKGILIGAAAILPGVSSGVLCVVFGLYDKLIDAITNLFKNPKDNFGFLLSITIGVFFGMILFGNVLNFLFSAYSTQCYFTFIGLMIGTIPILFKRANKNGFRLHYVGYFLLTFMISILLFVLKENIDNNIEQYTQISIFEYMLIGFIMSIGIVVPGVSKTAILMILGVYKIYLDAVATINFFVLIPMGIGIIIGGLIFIKIIQMLFQRAYSQIYYSIIGFAIGSVLIIYPRDFI